MAEPVVVWKPLACLSSDFGNIMGNSLDKLRHPRYDAYSAQQVLLNKQQIWCGGAFLDCYHIMFHAFLIRCTCCYLFSDIPFQYS